MGRMSPRDASLLVIAVSRHCRPSNRARLLRLAGVERTRRIMRDLWAGRSTKITRALIAWNNANHTIHAPKSRRGKP